LSADHNAADDLRVAAKVEESCGTTIGSVRGGATLRVKTRSMSA
jgi:hypothetical protein